MSTAAERETTSNILPAQLLVNLLCSRTRAAVKEATSEARKMGPNEYYSTWLARMKMEMVWRSTTCVLIVLHSKLTHDFSGSCGGLSWKPRLEKQISLHRAILQTNQSYDKDVALVP
jgi:hypothetical protein